MASKKIVKRSGKLVLFDVSRIEAAIFNAFRDGSPGHRKSISKALAQEVKKELDGLKGNIELERIQDTIEKVLMVNSLPEAAKAFIIYRQKRKELRELKQSVLGLQLSESDKNLSINSLILLRERYLKRDSSGEITETPEQMFTRVAENIAAVEKLYGKKPSSQGEKFFSMIDSLDFLPNSPTLMNSGSRNQQLSACFVLPIHDSLESIFTTLKNAALIHQSGGGTGFSFSSLRPKGDYVRSSCGVASGPLAFLDVFDSATQTIKQGGRRRGANMAVLHVSHPDIVEFITAKEDLHRLQNFNLSVAITDRFMDAVVRKKVFPLVNPKDGTIVKYIDANALFGLIVYQAWKTGEPGILFIDSINCSNPLKGSFYEATNPCGEQPLLAYESCNLGSINLSNFAENRKVDWKRLGETIRISVRFLDNVIDANNYPLKEIEAITRANRKIGLGIMGFADLLYQLEVRYDSKKSLELADGLMGFVKKHADSASEELAGERGSFPNIGISVYPRPIRNATRTTIAPTGSLSMIADCSSGIEPNFALTYVKKVLGGRELLYVNRHFEAYAREHGFYSEQFMRELSSHGGIQHMDGIDDRAKMIFRVAHDISPEWHVKVQAGFQKHVDNGVSKTINFPSHATVEEVKRAFLMAHKLGCKGTTAYRDSSRGDQVLNIAPVVSKLPLSSRRICPVCNINLVAQEGCLSCRNCGYSVCL